MKPTTWGWILMTPTTPPGRHILRTHRTLRPAHGAHRYPISRADNLGFCAPAAYGCGWRGWLIEQIVPDLAVEPRELIAAGDVRPLEFRFQDGWVEHSREGLPDRDVSG